MARKFPPSVGGMERYAADLHEALAKQADVSLIKWGGSNKYLPLVLPWFFIKACYLLMTKKVDVIHIQDGLQAPIGATLKLLFRKPLCIVAHGLDITFENKLYQKVIPAMLRRADYVFCISNAARDEVIKRGIPADKAVFHALGMNDTIYNGDKQASRLRLIEKLKIADDSKIILSTGRLVKRKGVDWFINNIFPDILKSNGKAFFAISGDGEDRSRIEASVSRLKLEKSVAVLGRTDDAFLKDLYNGADIFVMPNIRVEGDMEGFGLVLLEAALCELPIVATGIEGINDAIENNKNGILVPENDKETFTRQTLSFLNDNALAAKFGKAARQYTLEHNNWSTIAQQYIKVYQRLIASKQTKQ